MNGNTFNAPWGKTLRWVPVLGGLPLAGLKSAGVAPQPMRGGLRLFGNGGLFSIPGLYRNRAPGGCRALVMNLKDTVVLRFEKRTVIIPPENPEWFVAEISPFANRNSQT